MKSKLEISELSEKLQSLQRQRSIVLKSRNMQAARLQAIVAGTLGYSSGLPEKERDAKFKEASQIIDKVVEGDTSHPLHKIIQITMVGIDAFNETKAELEKEMIATAKKLPVAKWVSEKEQRGFGLLFLAIVIGEAGDLSDLGAISRHPDPRQRQGYANPARLWRRLGCAPWSFDGKTLMGATWRSGREGKLPTSEWEQFGYSPRRRSIAYLIGEGIVKQNFLTGEYAIGIGCEGTGQEDTNGSADENVPRADKNGSRRGTASSIASGGRYENEAGPAGPYRARYDEAKANALANRPDWTRCPKCDGKPKGCSNCKGTGKVAKRCHLHGMLLATKLLLKNLWIEWNGHPPMPKMVMDTSAAAAAKTNGHATPRLESRSAVNGHSPSIQVQPSNSSAKQAKVVLKPSTDVPKVRVKPPLPLAGKGKR